MYLYYAIFSPEGKSYNVSFPDLDGAFTFGDSMQEALAMAKELLEGWLIVAENENDPIPIPSEPHELTKELEDLIIPIAVDLKLAREKYNNKLVKKTLTIPAYINQLGIENNINFSQTLTEAIQTKLGI